MRGDNDRHGGWGGSNYSQRSHSSHDSQDRRGDRRRSGRQTIPSGGRSGSLRKSKKPDGYFNKNGIFVPTMSKPLVSFQQFSSI